MPRYQVNATVMVDAWAYLEAEDSSDAYEKSRTLDVGDFELGDRLHVEVNGLDLDE